LAGGRDKQPTIFDVETGKTLKRWRGHGGTVNAVRGRFFGERIG